MVSLTRVSRPAAIDALYDDIYSAYIREMTAVFTLDPEWMPKSEFIDRAVQFLRQYPQRSEFFDALRAWLDGRLAEAKYWAGFWHEECLPV